MPRSGACDHADDPRTVISVGMRCRITVSTDRFGKVRHRRATPNPSRLWDAVSSGPEVRLLGLLGTAERVPTVGFYPRTTQACGVSGPRKGVEHDAGVPNRPVHTILAKDGFISAAQVFPLLPQPTRDVDSRGTALPLQKRCRGTGWIQCGPVLRPTARFDIRRRLPHPESHQPAANDARPRGVRGEVRCRDRPRTARTALGTRLDRAGGRCRVPPHWG